MVEPVLLTGDDLALADVWEVAIERRPVALTTRAEERIRAARSFLEARSTEHTYGVNTGFG
ncbi:MAG: aromatic amino acid lyase, partial [Gaiella sp.]